MPAKTRNFLNAVNTLPPREQVVALKGKIRAIHPRAEDLLSESAHLDGTNLIKALKDKVVAESK